MHADKTRGNEHRDCIEIKCIRLVLTSWNYTLSMSHASNARCLVVVVVVVVVVVFVRAWFLVNLCWFISLTG